MAFLCPSRLGGKEKKKKKEREPLFGRITGSDSVDTLVRVGLEKRHGLSADSRMVVVHDFTACADRELTLRQGQDAYVLYEENGWAYVLTEDNKEGFLPLSFLTPWKDSRRSVSPTVQNRGEVATNMFSVSESESCTSGFQCSFRSSDSPRGAHVFKKQSYGRYVVVFDFERGEDDDVSVERLELVTVFNMEDPDWYWVGRSTGEEGFVPRNYLCPYPADLDLVGTCISGRF